MPLVVLETESTVVGTATVDIVVPYTTPQLTRLAVREADELAAKLPSRIRVLRLHGVPFPDDLRYPPVALDILREQARQVARGVKTSEITLVLTRDPEAALLKTLRPGSIVVIGTRKRWWRTAQERLARICERHGYQVAIVYSR
jgi:hypothetical protein